MKSTRSNIPPHTKVMKSTEASNPTGTKARTTATNYSAMYTSRGDYELHSAMYTPFPDMLLNNTFVNPAEEKDVKMVTDVSAIRRGRA